MDVAEALVATASAGVVHRDVKPSNILLGPDCAKLSDFGIAKALDRPAITEIGIGLGTLAYCAPEQALSAMDVDPRADIYGLGATLYHLVTGRPPYDTTRPVMQILTEITGDGSPAPIREHRPDVPKPLVDLIESMLQKDPAKRPQTAAAVVTELKRIGEFVLRPDTDLSQTHSD
jgi:serine/threonine-protein kinase